MSKSFYQTTKTVRVIEKDKVIVRAPGVVGPKGDPGTSVLTGPGLPSNLIGKIGDLYIDTNTKIVYGPKTYEGWDTTTHLIETFDRSLLGRVFNVTSDQTSIETINGQDYYVWAIEHDLGYNPNATIIDSSDSVIEGEVSYPDENTIVLRFKGANSGRVYLS
jgi:hypothetical protein